MYELKRITDPGELVKVATARRPTGPGFSMVDAERATILVVEGASFNDPGPDFSHWKLLDAGGAEVASAHVPGY